MNEKIATRTDLEDLAAKPGMTRRAAFDLAKGIEESQQEVDMEGRSVDELYGKCASCSIPLRADEIGECSGCVFVEKEDD